MCVCVCDGRVTRGARMDVRGARQAATYSRQGSRGGATAKDKDLVVLLREIGRRRQPAWCWGSELG